MSLRSDVPDNSAYWDALAASLAATVQQRRATAHARVARQERMLWPVGIAAAIALTIVAIRAPVGIVAESTDAAGRVIAAGNRAPRVATLLYPDTHLAATRAPSVGALLVSR